MATKLHFSKSEALRFGFATTKRKLGFLVGAMLVVFAVNTPPQIIAGLEQEKIIFLPAVISFIVIVASWVIQLVTQLGLIKITLLFLDDQKPKISDLFESYRLLLNYVIASVLYGLIVFVGFLLLVIPGIIWMIQFSFYGYFIVDKKASPMEALKRSSEITKGVKWNLFLFLLILIGINLLGVVALFVGLLVAIPTTMLATAFVYRKLLAQLQ